MKNIFFILPVLLVCIILFNYSESVALDAGCAELNSVKVCPEPSPPILPGAGNSFVDPTFGTTIIQVTDIANDPNKKSGTTMARHNYSFWSSFNADSTRFIINKGSSAAWTYIYSFNPTKLSVAEIGKLFPASQTLPFETLVWDRSDPDLLYGASGTKIYKYIPSTQTFNVYKDLTGQCNDIRFMNMDGTGRWFSFFCDGAADNANIVSAWDSLTDQVYSYDFAANNGIPNLHAQVIDISGTYVWVSKVPYKISWEILTNQVVIGQKGNPDRAHGHFSQGYKKIFHADSNDCRSIIIRDITNPDPAVNWNHIFEVPGGQGACQEPHFSSNHATGIPQYVYSERYFTFNDSGKVVSAPYQQEIIKVWTDTSNLQHVQRLAHHHSWVPSVNPYYKTPRSSVSYDDKFIMFDSNWGGSGFINVFILQIDNTADDLAPAPPKNVRIILN